jgi:choline dehydrogenase-like flavoprotein
MYTDARTLNDGTTVEADVAVVGGGPAGITLARAFAGSGVEVCVIEAGGLQPDPEVQALYQGENAGIEYPLAAMRLRMFGGSSNHWGGYCRPLDPIDFEPRDWVPHSGWPFGIEELAPYYGPANEIVEVAPAEYDDLDYWAQTTGDTLPELATGRMWLRFVHFSPPTRFGEKYGPELQRSRNIRVLLNANVVNIQAAAEGRTVNGFAIRTLNGLNHRVTARYYVVACGGLENARILLLSNDVVPSGLGNQNDLVGRFFMEHPHLGGFGEIVVADLQRLPPIYRDRILVHGHNVKAAFNPSAAFLREQRLLNATFMGGVAGEYHRGGKAGAESEKAAAHADMLMAAQRFLADGAGPVKADDPDYLGVWLGMGCACEQAPNPDSRVMLSSERDALGLARIKLDWRLTEQDRYSLLQHMHSLAYEFGALGIGRLVLNVADDSQWPEVVAGGAHHMGTTRMHEDPRQGVVDRNSKVHGVDNLYVAGSSVFPTSGAANPTLTLVALTLRLADHLRSQLQ